jgi:hypothetical protein
MLEYVRIIGCQEEIKYSMHQFSSDFATFYYLSLSIAHVQQHSVSNPTSPLNSDILSNPKIAWEG